jgi:hypothetical protein
MDDDQQSPKRNRQRVVIEWKMKDERAFKKKKKSMYFVVLIRVEFSAIALGAAGQF